MDIRQTAIDDVNTLPELEITQSDFDKLLAYNTSLPTGQHEGKRWKCNLVWHQKDSEPVWAIYEYGKTFMQGEVEMRDIKHYKPKIID